MHTMATMSRSRAVEAAMDMQCLALRRIAADDAESDDYHELACLAATLEGLAHRCMHRDEDENRDHGEMRQLAQRICTILEGLDNEVDNEVGKD